MIQINRWTVAALTATSLMIALLIAGTSFVQAATVERRAVNKLVKDFPETTDLSTPESAVAAAARNMARFDVKAAWELSWTKLDAETAKDIEEALKHEPTLPKNYSQLMLDSEIIEVLTYNNDLAVVICKSGLPGAGPFGLEPFGRIDGVWKAIALPGFEEGSLPSAQAAEERFEKEKDDLWQKFVAIRDEVKNGRTPLASLAKGGKNPLPSLSAAEKEDIKRWQGTTWRIGIGLDMPSLEPQAVQYAIFDKDPVAAFTAEVKKMQSYFRKDSEKPNNAAREQLQGMRMAAWWDTGFKEIPGNSVWLLTGRPAEGQGMSSNSHAGKKWVVSRTVLIHGKPVCWCIPVEVKTGEQIDVVFNESNTFDLQAAYDNAMREPNGSADKK